MALPPRWRKVARDIGSHKLRTALVVLSIAVGVFAVAVVMGGRGILLREFDAEYVASNVPTAEFDTSSFDDVVVAAVRKRPEVRQAEGRRRVTVRFTQERRPGPTTAGWDTMRLWAVPAFDGIRIQRITKEQTTSWPPKRGEVVLEQSALQTGDYEVGDMLTVQTPQGTRTRLRVVGFVHDINAIPTQFTDTVVGFTTFDTLPKLDEPQQYNHLSLVLAEEGLNRAEASRVAAQVRDEELIENGIRVFRTEVPEPGSHFLGDIFKALSLLLLAIGVLSLALSGFLVITTISALISQQIKQVGIMKAIGARRTQIAGMYLALVLVYGMMAVAIGVPAAMWAASRFALFAGGILNFRIVDPAPPDDALVLAVIVGLVIPVLAAVIPVSQGVAIPVVSALNATGIKTTFGHGIIDRILGLMRGLPRPVALSLRNTFIRKGRLALVLVTLGLASAVIMSVLTVRASILRTVEDMASWWHYDAMATLSRPIEASSVERASEDVPGVLEVETWVESQVALKRADGSQNEALYAIGLPHDSNFISPRIVRGRWLAADDENALVVNTDVVKDEPGIEVGDSIDLDIRGEESEWTVVGIASGQLMGPVMFTSRDALEAAARTQGTVGRVLVQTDAHAAVEQARTARQLETALDEAGVPVATTQTSEGQSAEVASQLGILVTFLVIMGVIVTVVGVIGLTGTMTINVLESTREIGVMRSIGARHGSIFGVFVTEGVVVAVLAWAIGAAVSWPLSVWLVDALGAAMSLPLSYDFSFSGVAAWLVAVCVIAALASLLPAWNASRVSVRDAITYE